MGCRGYYIVKYVGYDASEIVIRKDDGTLVIPLDKVPCSDYDYIYIPYSTLKKLYKGCVDREFREMANEFNKLRRSLQQFRDKQANALNEMRQNIQHARRDMQRIQQMLREVLDSLNRGDGV